jgi:hypothetical protein
MLSLMSRIGFKRRRLRRRAAWLTMCFGAALASPACTRASTRPATSPYSTPGAASAVRVTAARPKYPAATHPLSREHAFLRQAPAPDFWAFAPYYVGQIGDSACSAASLAMLVNAARHGRALDSETPLVSQALLRERVANASWERGLAPDGEGVTLDQLGVLAEQSLRAFGLEPRRVQVTHVPDTSAEALARWRAVLRENERSASDWLFVNFLASSYVGVGEYGHIAPVGAYDESSRRVLVLDPDRTWYEPYWIADDVALAGMATRDPVSGAPRGYLLVSACDGACPP